MKSRILICVLVAGMLLSSMPIPFAQTAKAIDFIVIDSDIDFSAGSFNDTNVEDSGSGANLSLLNQTWFDSDWPYRIPISFSGMGDDLYGYQMRLEIDTSTPIGNGDMNANGSDIRFSDGTGNYLNYWLEGPIDNANTVIWVNVTQIAAAGFTTIYMYYGNPTALDESDFDNTFYWRMTIVDTGAGVGEYPGLGIDSNDLPHITYEGDAFGHVISYATIPTGSATFTTEPVTTNAGGSHGMPEIALNASGVPHITYYNQTGSNHLDFVNNSGGAFDSPEVVATDAGILGATHSLTFDSTDRAHVSYYESNLDDLNYGNRTSPGVWTSISVDSAGDVGVYSSLDLDSNDWPHFAHYDTDNTNLKYANYSGIWSSNNIDTAGDFGKFPTIQLDSNEMTHIVYGDGGASSLKYANQAGAGWNISTLVPSVGMVSSFVLNSSDNPHITYFDGPGQALKYMYHNGSAWVTQTVDASAALGTGQHSSLALDSLGFPQIAYSADNGLGELRFAQRRHVVYPVPAYLVGAEETERYNTAGTFESGVFDVGTTDVTWLELSWDAELPYGTGVSFQIASNNDMATWDYWGADGTSATNYTSTPTAIHTNHNGDQYLKVRAYLNTSDTNTKTPLINSITLELNRKPLQPTPTVPAGGSWLSDNTPLFQWAINDPDAIDGQTVFQIFIDDDPGFGSVDFDSGAQSFTEPLWSFPMGTDYTTIPDGDWYWIVRMQDESGWWSDYSAVSTFSIDTVAPVTAMGTGSPSYDGGNVTYVTSATQFNLTASDAGSGVNSTWYRIDSGAWTEYAGPFDLSGLPGNHLIYYNSTDNASKNEVPNVLAVVVDDTAPSTGWSVDGPFVDNTTKADELLFMTSESKLILTADDGDGSGVFLIYYRIDEGTWNPYFGSVNISHKWRRVIDYYAVDNLGNIEDIQTLTVFIEAEPPATYVSASSGVTYDDVTYFTLGNTFSIRAMDLPYTPAIPGGLPNRGAGVNASYYRVDDNAWQVYDAALTPQSMGIVAGGKHTLGYYSVDNLGNTEIARYLTIFYDIATPRAVAGNDVVPTVDVPVTFNGLASFDDGIIVNWTWLITDYVTRAEPVTLYGSVISHTFGEAGQYLVTLSVLDALGNRNNDSLFANVTVIEDSDGDGLTNEQEQALGTDPNTPDESIGDFIKKPFLIWWLGWLLAIVFLVLAIVFAYLYVSKKGGEEEVQKTQFDIPKAAEKKTAAPAPAPAPQPTEEPDGFHVDEEPEVPEELADEKE